MSIKSFRQNVQTGVVGPYAPVCFPAAIEQLSRFSYGAEIYEAYLAYIEKSEGWTDAEHRAHVHEFEDLIEKLVKPLGGLTIDDIIFKNVTTVNGLRRAYRSLTKAGYNLVAEIACVPRDPESHGVGIVPVQGDFVTLVSTHIPKKLQGVIHIDAVGACLFPTEEKKLPGHPIHTSNVTAIPNL